MNEPEVKQLDKKYAAQRAYYQRHKEELKQKSKEYYEAHREVVIERTSTHAKKIYEERKKLFHLVQKLETQGIKLEDLVKDTKKEI
jgi:phosphoribosyl-ATP pyrophosphohydrolase